MCKKKSGINVLSCISGRSPKDDGKEWAAVSGSHCSASLQLVFILPTVWRCCMSTKTSKLFFPPVKQEVRMPLSRTHLWNEANQNKRQQQSHLQVDHEFNESLAVMHFVHGYGLCRSRRRNHRSQCSTIWVLSTSYLDMWVYPKTNQLVLQTTLRMTVRKNDCSTNCNGIQIMYFCHNWQGLLKKLFCARFHTGTNIK